MKKYPSPSKQVNKPDPSEPKMVDSTKTQSVTAGEVNTDAQGKVVGKESKVKAAYGQTKGLLWYNYIKQVDYILATEHLLRKYRERKEALTQTLASGSIEDFQQYQRIVGEIAGLSFAEQEIQTLHSNMEDAND